MTTQEKIDKLKEARALIAEPEHWCKRALHRNAKRRPVMTRKAWYSHCAYGALEVVMEGASYAHVASPLENTLRYGGVFQELATWQDEHTHAEVLQLFDDTVARLEAQAVTP